MKTINEKFNAQFDSWYYQTYNTEQLRGVINTNISTHLSILSIFFIFKAVRRGIVGDGGRYNNLIYD